MKIAATADSQVDEHSRLEEHDRVMEFIARDAARRGCSLMLHAGDIYERRSTIRERQSVQAWARAVTKNMPLLVCGGNHETPGEVEELSGFVDSEIHAVSATEDPWLSSHRGGAQVQYLPWPRRASLLAWLRSVDGGVATREDVNQRGAEMLRDILRGFASHWKDGEARILVAHAMVRGSLQGPDQPPLLGCDFELGIEDLALADADVVILGHVHMPQEWSYRAADGREVPVIYCGSPRRTAFAKGEQEEKGYVVVEFDGRRLVSWGRVPTPATPLLLLEAAWDAGDQEFIWSSEEPVLEDGAEVRFRYEVDSDQREIARREAESLAAAWIEEERVTVKIEEQVRPTVRARAPEVAEAVGVGAQLRAFWDATDPDLGEARRERLLSRVEELQEASS